MIRCTLLMVHLEFLYQCLNCFIQEVQTSVTHQNLRVPKPWQNIHEYKLRSGFFTAILHELCLGSSSQVICCSDNITCSCLLLWWINRSNKVNCPFIKCLQHDLWIYGKFIPLRWSSSLLTHITRTTILLRIFMLLEIILRGGVNQYYQINQTFSMLRNIYATSVRWTSVYTLLWLNKTAYKKKTHNTLQIFVKAFSNVFLKSLTILFT